MEKLTRLCITAAITLLLTACEGQQSALAGAGIEAQRIEILFWWMLTVAVWIWVAVIGIALYALRTRRRDYRNSRLAGQLILGGGVIFPVCLLTLLLFYSLPLLSDLREENDIDLNVSVIGERWWWRVQYQTDTGAMELANEIRLPAGRRVLFSLTSHEVIHSFWIPALGGKMDMIPGRVTRLILEPVRIGHYRGVCAEFCGAAHALMNLSVQVMEPEAFAEWLAAQARTASTDSDATAFLANGCGACHTVRGTAADGVIGPDLTHVGSRLSLAAGSLPNSRTSLIRWIRGPEHVKPGALMPSFEMVGEDQIDSIAQYLEDLK